MAMIRFFAPIVVITGLMSMVACSGRDPVVADEANERRVVERRGLAPGVGVGADLGRHLVVHRRGRVARHVEARVVVGAQQRQQVVRNGAGGQARGDVPHAQAPLGLPWVGERLAGGRTLGVEPDELAEDVANA